MQSALAVKDPAYLDQMKVYMVDNNELTTLDPSKTCGDQNVKSGGHVLFTRVPKESLNVDRYSIVLRLLRESSGGFQHQPMGSPPTNKPNLMSGNMKIPGSLPGINTKGGVQMNTGLDKN